MNAALPMAATTSWGLFAPELALCAALVGLLALELTLGEHERRERLPWAGIAGVAMAFLALWFQAPGTHTAFAGLWTVDPLARFFKGIFLLAATYALYMSRLFADRFERGHGEYTMLILTACTGMCAVASSSDLLMLFVALETVTLSLYIMCAFLRSESASIEAAIKYLLLGALAAGLYLMGASLLYGATGATAYADVRLALAGLEPGAHGAATLGALMIFSALSFKIAAVPFQLWAPDVYQGAPTPTTAYLATASKAVGFVALLRFFSSAIPAFAADWKIFLGVLSAATMIYGNFGALLQTDLKRLLAYSSIGHAGYLLMGVACFSSAGMSAVGYYMLAYLFATGVAFLVLILASTPGSGITSEIASFRGLGRRSPLMAATLLLALLSLAGLPPLGGFFAKFLIFVAAVDSKLIWLVVIGVLNVVVSLYYYLQVVRQMYLCEPTITTPLEVSPLARSWQYASLAAILILGTYVEPFMKLVGKIASGL